jgi:hypothetical protein
VPPAPLSDRLMSDSHGSLLNSRWIAWCKSQLGLSVSFGNSGHFLCRFWIICLTLLSLSVYMLILMVEIGAIKCASSKFRYTSTDNNACASVQNESIGVSLTGPRHRSHGVPSWLANTQAKFPRALYGLTDPSVAMIGGFVEVWSISKISLLSVDQDGIVAITEDCQENLECLAWTVGRV